MSWDLSSKWLVNYSICVFVGPDFQYCAHLSLVSVIDKHTQICPTCFNILQTTPSKYKEKKKNLVALWMFLKSWSTLYMPTRQLRTTHLLVFGEFSKENISLFSFQKVLAISVSHNVHLSLLICSSPPRLLPKLIGPHQWVPLGDRGGLPSPSPSTHSPTSLVC